MRTIRISYALIENLFCQCASEDPRFKKAVFSQSLLLKMLCSSFPRGLRSQNIFLNSITVNNEIWEFFGRTQNVLFSLLLKPV